MLSGFESCKATNQNHNQNKIDDQGAAKSSPTEWPSGGEKDRPVCAWHCWTAGSSAWPSLSVPRHNSASLWLNPGFIIPVQCPFPQGIQTKVESSACHFPETPVTDIFLLLPSQKLLFLKSPRSPPQWWDRHAPCGSWRTCTIKEKGKRIKLQQERFELYS